MKAKIGGRVVELEVEGRVRDGRTEAYQANRIGLQREISMKMVGGLGQIKNQPNTHPVRENHSGIPPKRTQSRFPQNSQERVLSPYRSKLEAAFARSLEFDRLAGMILGYQYEPMNIRLSGDKNFYKPDFLVWSKDHPPTYYEVKGRNKSDERSLVKTKVAAALHPWARFILIKRIRGVWVEREIAAS